MKALSIGCSIALCLNYNAHEAIILHLQPIRRSLRSVVRRYILQCNDVIQSKKTYRNAVGKEVKRVKNDAGISINN